MIYLKDIQAAQTQFGQTQKNLRKFSKSKRKDLDEFFHSEHTKVFKKIDCLACANCCKTTSPIFRDVDIKRISKRLKMPEKEFIKNYLRVDEDRDYVLQSSPCHFLNEDNTCSIYEDRPLACREYPHTDRKNMYQIVELTIQNSLICPAVSQIVQQINRNYEKSS